MGKEATGRGKHMAEHMRDVTEDEQGLFITPEDTTDLSGAVPDVPKYLMPSKVYDVLKWVCLIVLPALATFIGHVGPSWGIPHVDAIVLTITEVGLLIGACIGASHMSAMGR